MGWCVLLRLIDNTSFALIFYHLHPFIDYIERDSPNQKPVEEDWQQSGKVKKSAALSGGDSHPERNNANGGRSRNPSGGRGGAGGRGSGGERGDRRDTRSSSNRENKSVAAPETNAAVKSEAKSSSSAPANPTVEDKAQAISPKSVWGFKEKTVAVSVAAVAAEPVHIEPVHKSQQQSNIPAASGPPTVGAWGKSGGKTLAEVLKQKEKEKLAPPPAPAPVALQTDAASGESGDGKKGGKRPSRDRKPKKGSEESVVIVDSTVIEQISLAGISTVKEEAPQNQGPPALPSAPQSPARPSTSAGNASPALLVKMGKWAAPSTEDQPADELKFGNFGANDSSTFNWGSITSTNDAPADSSTGNSVWSSSNANNSGSTDVVSSGSAGPSRAPPGLEAAGLGKNQRSAPGQSRGNKNEMNQPMQGYGGYNQPPGIGNSGRTGNATPMPTGYGGMPYPSTGFEQQQPQQQQQQYYGATSTSVDRGQSAATGGAPNTGAGGAQQQSQQPQQQQPQPQQFPGQFYNPYFYQQPYYHAGYGQPQVPFYGQTRGGMYQGAPRGAYPQDNYNVSGGMYSAEGMYSGAQFADASGYGMPMQQGQSAGVGAQGNKNKGPNSGAAQQQGLPHGAEQQGHNAGMYQQGGYGGYPNQWNGYPQAGYGMPMPFPMATPVGNAGQPGHGFPGQQGGRDSSRNYGNRSNAPGSNAGSGWSN